MDICGAGCDLDVKKKLDEGTLTFVSQPIPSLESGELEELNKEAGKSEVAFYKVGQESLSFAVEYVLETEGECNGDSHQNPGHEETMNATVDPTLANEQLGDVVTLEDILGKDSSVFRETTVGESGDSIDFEAIGTWYDDVQQQTEEQYSDNACAGFKDDEDVLESLDPLFGLETSLVLGTTSSPTTSSSLVGIPSTSTRSSLDSSTTTRAPSVSRSYKDVAVAKILKAYNINRPPPPSFSEKESRLQSKKPLVITKRYRHLHVQKHDDSHSDRSVSSQERSGRWRLTQRPKATVVFSNGDSSCTKGRDGEAESDQEPLEARLGERAPQAVQHPEGRARDHEEAKASDVAESPKGCRKGARGGGTGQVPSKRFQKLEQAQDRGPLSRDHPGQRA